MFDFSEFKERLIHAGFGNAQSIVGCDEKAIAKIEKELGRPLPEPYRAFLETFGVASAGFWSDVDFTIDKLKQVNKDFATAIELLALEGYDVKLPNDAFAICTLRRERYEYILLDSKNADCPIYKLNTDLGTQEKYYDSFLEMLETNVKTYEELAARNFESR